MGHRQFVTDRVKALGSSGIRRAFDLGAKLRDPINFSIGQPDFPVPDAVKEAIIRAVRDNRSGYTPTRGIPELRDKLTARLESEFGVSLDVFITSGVSGALTLAFMACLNPGDEVVFADPYFVSYPQLVRLAGGTPVPVDVYPDFRLYPDRVAGAITPRTKAIILCSPANPTGMVYRAEDVSAVAELACRHDLLLIADEIYEMLSYDGPSPSVVSHAPERTVLIRGFGKSYAMTGLRIAYAAGPTEIITEMAKLQQYTYVCAPQPAQWGALVALDTDMSSQIAVYKGKRDLVCRELTGAVQFTRPSGGFYIFPQVPERFESAASWCEQALAQNLIIIAGEVFSSRNTHFRISYAAPDSKIRAGCEVIRKLAAGG